MEFLECVFKTQKELQEQLYGENCKNVERMYGAATAAIVEIGEMLQFDTRWKKYVTGSCKEPVFDYEQFKEEWVDAFIYLLNTLIFADVSLTEIYEKIKYKQDKNLRRFNQ